MMTKLLGASGWMMLVKLLGAMSGYALAWMVTQNEGAAAYGRFELGLTVLSIGALAVRLGLDGVMVKWLASARAKGLVAIQRRVASRAVLVVVVAGGLASIGILESARALTAWADDEATMEMWPWVAVGVPLMGLWGLSAEMLRGLSQMKRYALAQQGLLTAVAVVLLWWTSWNVVPAYASAVVIVTVLVFGLMVSALPWGDSGEAPMDGSPWSWKAMMTTGWPMLMGSAMYLVMSWSDTLLVSHFLEEDQVGVYRLTFKLAAVVTLVQAAVNSYAAPLFAERHAVGDQQGLRDALRHATLLNVAFSVPAFVAILALGPMVLDWFGPDFVQGQTCLIWLAIGQLSMTLCGPVMYVLNMTGFERIGNRILWSTALVNIALNVWIIPRHGIEGAAFATAVSLALWNGAAAWAVRKKLGLSVWRDVFRGRHPS